MDKDGRRIGGYTLERPLGEGGMGRVWLARRSDGRCEGRVAIKVLTGGRPGEEGAARLAHRNLLTQRARTILGVMLAQGST